ncbi:hypothetical protein L7F22_015640 [Adiantum nelumboides]|nr:hypothetical protein [Adiantum nelumboides]
MSIMKESKPPRLPVAATTTPTSCFMQDAPPSRCTHHLPPSSPSPSPSFSSTSVLSSHSSTSLSKSSPSSAISPSCPTKAPFSLLRRRKATTTTKWVSRLFRLHKHSMEAADEGLLLNAHSQGLHGSWGDAADQQLKADQKPKRELRFAAKIAAAMDADGFIGVKDSVCAEDTPAGMQQSVCVKNTVNLYCASSPASFQRAPLKQQARPRRRKWRLFRRLRKTRLLISSILQKVKLAFAKSSKRSLQVRDGFVK